jgi:hypothetical protein
MSELDTVTWNDANADGMGDSAAVDANGDGFVDTVMMDTDFDGHVETFGFDTDANGVIDAVSVDTDHDGVLDTSGFDTDGNGLVDVVAGPGTGGVAVSVDEVPPPGPLAQPDPLAQPGAVIGGGWTDPLINETILNDPQGAQLVHDIFESRNETIENILGTDDDD